MKIFIAADHRGVGIKAKVIDFLKQSGHDVVDMGTNTAETPCDYPPLAYKVAVNVSKNSRSRGILVCMSGVGLCIAANKVPGAYAALCYNKEVAVLSRQHNNANILVLGAKFVSSTELTEIVEAWLKTDFEGGRHLRRFKQIQDIEKKIKAGE